MQTFKEKWLAFFINDIRKSLNVAGALKNLKICTLIDFFVHGI